MSPTATPGIFRILLPALDLRRSRRFYETLLGTQGREVAGGRVYFDCGPVIMGLLDCSGLEGARLPTPAEAIYLATDELDVIHGRAKKLRCLSKERLHGDPKSPLGQPLLRPWGERSFYVEDPTGNPLCFVDRRTKFTGTPAQVARLRALSGEKSGRTARVHQRR